jgi:PhnB protein
MADSAPTAAFATSIAPWLSVEHAQESVDFYKDAFGAVEAYRLENDNGALAVAQLSIEGAAFWVQEDRDASPKTEVSGSVRLILSVDDPDAVFDRAIARGAVMVKPVSEEYGWRTGRLTDPSGHEWEISRQL